MSKVEFNNCFFGRIDRGILCRVYSRLGLPQPLVPVLVWPCSGTRAAVSPGSLSVVPCGSVPEIPRALLLSPSRAGACLGLCGCWGQEPQKGMLVTGLPRDAFPLGVVRVEVTLLPGGFTPALAGGAGAAVGSGRAAVFCHCWVLGLHHHHLIIFPCINCPWLTCKDNCAL